MSEKTIEQLLADAKERSMRYTPYQGLAVVPNWFKLKYIALNLKNDGDSQVDE
jgi:hypothetical protein